jgi:hypothetical protein
MVFGAVTAGVAMGDFPTHVRAERKNDRKAGKEGTRDVCSDAPGALFICFNG